MPLLVGEQCASPFTGQEALEALSGALARRGDLRRYPIGAVTFRRGMQHQRTTLLGDLRIRVLRVFHRRASLGDLVPYIERIGPIAWEEIRWDTSGPRVTGGEHAATT